VVENVTVDLSTESEYITITDSTEYYGNFNIEDIIPDETIYIDGTLLLDGDQMTDQEDSDAGRYIAKDGDLKAKVEMSLGELDTTSHHTITYNLRIR